MSVLTLTAQAMRATTSDFVAAGFDSYLSKPVNVVRLVHTVRQQCPDVGREGPLPARPALALAHPGALAGLPSCGDGRP
jgi:CheY-like chemotaxis protein